ncbi:MAG: hypothetical protein HYZ20_02415 [Burkholderiales bacterium]|nr:hypothetical protein [Burkholderiales bacterium]
MRRRAHVERSGAGLNIFPYGVDQTSTWGDNTIGTPGGTVTWSLIADGTGLATGSPGYIHGSSQLELLFDAIDTAYGAGTALAALQGAFESWSAVADIQFAKTGVRSRVPHRGMWDLTPPQAGGATQPRASV